MADAVHNVEEGKVEWYLAEERHILHMTKTKHP